MIERFTEDIRKRHFGTATQIIICFPVFFIRLPAARCCSFCGRTYLNPWIWKAVPGKPAPVGRLWEPPACILPPGTWLNWGFCTCITVCGRENGFCPPSGRPRLSAVRRRMLLTGLFFWVGEWRASANRDRIVQGKYCIGGACLCG